MNIESKLFKNTFPLYARWWLYPTAQWRQRRYIASVKARKGRFTVVFFAMNVAMWKYQGIYELLSKDPRFRVHIVLSPALPYSMEQRIEDLQAMRGYFSEHKMDYIDWKLEAGAEPIDVGNELDPDILFYPQPYEYVLHPQHDFLQFYDRLLAYVHYGYSVTPEKLVYNKRFHNIAWRLYHANRQNLQMAQALADNHGRNVAVVGYASADRFLSQTHRQVWKACPTETKKIVWAPHFSISNQSGPFALSNFLWMAEPMLQLARRYEGVLQIAFKPHPRLKTELYEHKQWGRQKTDDYYAKWANGTNTQLELGDFSDLFAGSDAMIHDCSSFLIDYLYFRKPVLFVSKQIETARSYVNEVGKAAYDAHYSAENFADVEQFVSRQVIAGEDPKKEARELVFHDYLLPPNGQTVAQNIYDDLICQLGF